jgi:hypothetical protein
MDYTNYQGQRSTHRYTNRYTLRNTLAGSKHERRPLLFYGGKNRRVGAKTHKVGKRGKGRRRGRQTLRKSRR